MRHISAEIRDKQIVELRDTHNFTFQKIAEIYGISRQRANVIYHKQRPSAPTRPRRFKKTTEEHHADRKN